MVWPSLWTSPKLIWRRMREGRNHDFAKELFEFDWWSRGIPARPHSECVCETFEYGRTGSGAMRGRNDHLFSDHAMASESQDEDDQHQLRRVRGDAGWRHPRT